MDDDRAGAVMNPHQCLCLFDCRDCSESGYEWHTHDDIDPCPMHPDALVVS
jgi:hypothetical protein